MSVCNKSLYWYARSHTCKKRISVVESLTTKVRLEVNPKVSDMKSACSLLFSEERKRKNGRREHPVPGSGQYFKYN